jgi:hypothetical protein
VAQKMVEQGMEQLVAEPKMQQRRWRSKRTAGGADERSRQDCTDGKAAASKSGVGPTGAIRGWHGEAGGVGCD